MREDTIRTIEECVKIALIVIVILVLIDWSMNGIIGRIYNSMKYSSGADGSPAGYSMFGQQTTPYNFFGMELYNKPRRRVEHI